MPRWIIYVVVLTVLLGIVAVIVATGFLEPYMMFFPFKATHRDTLAAYERVESGNARTAVKDVWLNTVDGVRIHAWLLTPRSAPDGVRPVVLWFHGNAGNLGMWLEEYEEVVALGAEVMAVDYRGFGRSEGSPNEEGVYHDADAAWEYLVKDRGVTPENVVIYGYSIGGAVAVDLAARVQPGGLILQSTFTSIPEFMRAKSMPIPTSIVRSQMASIDKIKKVTCPKLFIHGTEDELITFKLGQQLYDAATDPKEILSIKGADHNNVHFIGGRKLLDAIGRVLPHRARP